MTPKPALPTLPLPPSPTTSTQKHLKTHLHVVCQNMGRDHPVPVLILAVHQQHDDVKAAQQGAREVGEGVDGCRWVPESNAGAGIGSAQHRGAGTQGGDEACLWGCETQSMAVIQWFRVRSLVYFLTLIDLLTLIGFFYFANLTVSDQYVCRTNPANAI